MFRNSDLRRVQFYFDGHLEAPYEAECSLSADRLELRVMVRDPDNDALVVSSGSWTFNPRLDRSVKQPSDEEVLDIVRAHARICSEYPAKKAADAAEKAERDAQAAAIKAAKDAEDAARAAAEAPPAED
jgi:hypothetical protein